MFKKINKHFKFIYLILIIFTIVISPIFLAESSTAASNNVYEYKVLELVNNERAKLSIAPLKMDKSLSNAADIRTKEIKKSFSHKRPDGTMWYTVSSKVNGENIAYGQRTPKEVVNSWMNSPGHRSNILNSKFKSIGIGYYYSGTSYWVQLFSNKQASLIESKKSTIESQKLTINPTISLIKTNKKIIIKWKKISGADGYQIYRSSSENGKFKLKKTIKNGSTIQYTDNVLKKKKYYYKIRYYKKINGKWYFSNFSSIKQ